MPNDPLPQSPNTVGSQDTLLFHGRSASHWDIRVSRRFIWNVPEAVEEDEAAHARANVEEYRGVTNELEGNEHAVRVLTTAVEVRGVLEEEQQQRCGNRQKSRLTEEV